MAGEPILVVDDTPVNLKLTRILLVNEGYKVVTAASAEEALELLRNYRPRLILADIQLPGIDGLEMTRRIKGDDRTRDTLVVALTAFAMKGDEDRAREAGCDDYITKPIETRTLGARIRKLLDRTPTPPPPEGAPAAGSETISATEMQALRRRFLSEGQETARRLLLELDDSFHQTDAARPVHQWIGAGGLLGYTVISRLAREVESLFRERPLDTAQLRESLTNLVLAFATPREARDTPLPRAIVEALTGKRVALVGLPANETQRLCVALEYAAAHAEFFELASSPTSAEIGNCDLMVTWIHAHSTASPWLDPTAGNALPIVLVGSRDHLLALNPAVQAMAAGLLMDSWQPDEALVRLVLALTYKAPTRLPFPESGRMHLLVATADASVHSPIDAALQHSGMEVHRAADGSQALEIARRVILHAAVLDVNLPGLDGSQVVAELRAERPAPGILLLTAHQQEDEILRGFRLGADDYVVKPFSPLELIARLRRLIGQ